MKCKTVQDYLYGEKELQNNAWAFVERFRIALHLFGCGVCLEHKHIIEKSYALMQNDFLPREAGDNYAACGADSGIADSCGAKIAAPSGGLEFDLSDAVMNKIYAENTICEPARNDETLSMHAWALAGFLILLSLLTVYFSVQFLTLQESRLFFLPMGLTIGAVITAYGAIFIGSHLKELTAKFSDLLNCAPKN
jgi:hypothetical protein